MVDTHCTLELQFRDYVIQNELRNIVSMLFDPAKLSLTARSHPDVVQNPATKPSIEPSGHAIAPKSLSRIELGRPGTNWDMPTFSVFLCSQAECRRFDPDHPLSQVSLKQVFMRGLFFLHYTWPHYKWPFVVQIRPKCSAALTSSQSGVPLANSVTMVTTRCQTIVPGLQQLVAIYTIMCA
ncbi:MAG: hypothetical protein CMJ25_00475 [Phycisphaerae bacterium]|nr:hypothetical protein [Phycisphaerae bacterium]